MSKRRLIAILIAFVLTLAATAMWSAATIDREGDTDANAIEDGAQPDRARGTDLWGWHAGAALCLSEADFLGPQADSRLIGLAREHLAGFHRHWVLREPAE